MTRIAALDGDEREARYIRTTLATCCVPWNDDGTMAEKLFRESIRGQIAHGLRDLYVFGTAGEGYAVSEEQFDEVVRVFLEETDGTEFRPMVGIISLSLRTVIERIERCADRGVSTYQISLPSWGALSDHELRTFFDETCGRFPGLRFLHYNVARAQRLVTPDEYRDLASKHPNLVATKNSGASFVTIIDLLHKAGDLRHFFTEFGYSYGSMVGECGLLASTVSLNWTRLHEYFDAGVAQDHQRLTALAGELSAITAELSQIGGASAHMDGAFDKVFCKVHDPRFPLRLLPPYQSISDHDFERFCQVLRRRFPDWLEQ